MRLSGQRGGRVRDGRVNCKRKAAGMWAVGKKKKKKKPKKILAAKLKKGRHVGDGDVTMI